MIILLITSGYSQAGNAIKLWYRRIVSLKYSLRLTIYKHILVHVYVHILSILVCIWQKKSNVAKFTSRV